MVFTDFVVPELPYIVGLLVGTLIICVLLYAVRPPFTSAMVLAIVPWVITGASLHVFYQLHIVAAEDLYPPLIAPIFSAPSVYFTTFTALGIILTMSTMIVPTGHDKRVALYVGIMGIGITVPLVALVVWQGLGDVFEVNAVLPALGFIIALVVSFVLFIIIGIWRTHIIAQTRYAGLLVIFAHVFDAVTTAIGVELMDVGERSALPRMIMDFAAQLPTADTLGEAWLFVLIKIVIACGIVIIFADYVRDKPAEANLLFAIIVAVGLGPAVNNFFLFMLGV